jgi:serine/threonine protein kinase
MPRAGETIGHYRLLEPLGRGGMGEVWLADDQQLPRKVAIKLLPPGLGEDSGAIERLVREAQATARIEHPVVVTVYEAGDHEGRPYLVMQRYDGETLAERLERGPMPVAEVVSLAETLADALAEMHALGIVHRDLKPANVNAHDPRPADSRLRPRVRPGLAGSHGGGRPRRNAHRDEPGADQRPATGQPHRSLGPRRDPLSGVDW